MIRVPRELAERIERIQAELLVAYESGQTSRVELTDQGDRGAWISKATVISLALDELEDHKARSRKKPVAATSEQELVNS